MIDKNGRVGGKINLIDLLIILVLVAAVVFVAFRMTRSDDAVSTESPVKITVYADESYIHATDKLQPGLEVWDYTGNVRLGTLESWTLAPFTELVADGQSMPVEMPIEAKTRANLVISGTGTYSTHGITVDGVLYGLGHTMVIYAGECKFFVSVSGLEAA